ncbi:MAG: hypothetical protein ACI4U3_10865 [Traorella sp.]
MLNLSAIGLLIHYYRKEQQQTIASFLTPLPNEKPICCSKTLSSLEKGNIHKIEIYDALCKNIQKTILFDSQIDVHFSSFKYQLIHALEEMSIIQMKKLYQDLSIVSLNSSHIYYYELFCLYKDILVFYLYNQIPPIKDVDIFLKIEKVMDEDNRKLIIFFLYQLSNMNTMNIDRADIIKKCEPYLDDSLFFTRKLTDIYDHHTKFMTYGLYWEIQCSSKLNSFQQIYLKHMIAFCLLNGGEEKEAFLSLRSDLRKNSIHDFPDHFKVLLYVGYSISAFCVKEYEITAHYLLKVMKINYLGVNYNYLLLFNSLEKCHHEMKIPQIIQTINQNSFQNTTVKAIFTYYQIKYQSNINLKNKTSILEKIICQDLVQLMKFGSLYKDILIHELNELIFISKNYKALYMLIEK